MDLRVCVFCGSCDVGLGGRDPASDYVTQSSRYVRCNGCNTTGPKFYSESVQWAEERAIEAWNTRADESIRREVYKRCADVADKDRKSVV